MFRKLLIGASLLCSSAAHAEWHEATSANFIVYSEGSEQQARDFAAKLERFHFVLRTFHHVAAHQSPVKLRVFLLASPTAVGRMAGSSSIAGYYVTDARGLMLVGTSSHSNNSTSDPRSQHYEGDAALEPESILLHEYTHHFTFQYFPATYPTWYSEGFAEFWGATRFEDNDVVDVGLPAEHRFSTFRALGWLPLERLLRAHNYSEVGGENVFLLYAEGWLIVRYCFEHSNRQRQVQQYLRLINNGATYEDATRQAFPDLAAFNSELFQYAGASRFNELRLPFRTIDVGQIAVRTLRPAEQALITDEIKLSQGYSVREAADFARDVRGIAARFPDDPFATRMVMETAYLAGDNAAAAAAADRLLAVEPNNGRALVTRARIQIAGLAGAHVSDQAAWNAARQLLVRAMRASPNDPIVLQAYYQSFVAQGLSPPEDAQNALYTAMELAPSDGELRYQLARDFEQRHMIPEAIAIIRSEAYQVPHRGNESEADKRRREAREDRERQAGTVRHETALEMLNRLQGELNPRDRQRQTEAGH
jgi:tetratricopeptide (TPR) repeat protein